MGFAHGVIILDRALPVQRRHHEVLQHGLKCEQRTGQIAHYLYSRVTTRSCSKESANRMNLGGAFEVCHGCSVMLRTAQTTTEPLKQRTITGGAESPWVHIPLFKVPQNGPHFGSPPLLRAVL